MEHKKEALPDSVYPEKPAEGLLLTEHSAFRLVPPDGSFAVHEQADQDNESFPEEISREQLEEQGQRDLFSAAGEDNAACAQSSEWISDPFPDDSLSNEQANQEPSDTVQQTQEASEEEALAIDEGDDEDLDDYQRIRLEVAKSIEDFRQWNAHREQEDRDQEARKMVSDQIKNPQSSQQAMHYSRQSNGLGTAVGALIKLPFTALAKGGIKSSQMCAKGISQYHQIAAQKALVNLEKAIHSVSADPKISGFLKVINGEEKGSTQNQKDLDSLKSYLKESRVSDSLCEAFKEFEVASKKHIDRLSKKDIEEAFSEADLIAKKAKELALKNPLLLASVEAGGASLMTRMQGVGGGLMKLINSALYRLKEVFGVASPSPSEAEQRSKSTASLNLK